MDSADKWISPFAFKLHVPVDIESNIPPLAFNCSYASSVINKNAESTYNLRNPPTFADFAYKFCEFHLHLRIPLTFCGIHLQLRNPEQLAIFACCGIRSKTNIPKKFRLQVYVCGIHWNFVCGIHLHFGTYFKTCLWNPGIYRHKIVLLSSTPFGLVMLMHRLFLYERKLLYPRKNFRDCKPNLQKGK